MSTFTLPSLGHDVGACVTRRGESGSLPRAIEERPQAADVPASAAAAG